MIHRMSNWKKKKKFQVNQDVREIQRQEDNRRSIRSRKRFRKSSVRLTLVKPVSLTCSSVSCITSSTFSKCVGALPCPPKPKGLFPPSPCS